MNRRMSRNTSVRVLLAASVLVMVGVIFADDWVFTQFYPVLRAAKAKGK